MFVCCLNLNAGCCTCRSRGTIEFDFLVEVVIFFGGLGVDCEILMQAFVVLDHVVVVVLSGPVVHVSDRG